MRDTNFLVRGLVLSLACGLAVPYLLDAQTPPQEGPSFEAIEVFRPSTGDRQYRLVTPLSAEERRAAERALQEAGENPGPVDGQITTATKQALRAYQKRRGLTPCGCVNWKTVRRLGLPTTVTITEVASGEDPARETSVGNDVRVVYPNTPGPERRSERAAVDSAPSTPDTVVMLPRSRSRFHRGYRYGGIPVFVRPDGASGSTAGRTPSPSSAAVARTGVPRLLPFVRPVIPREGGRP